MRILNQPHAGAHLIGEEEAEAVAAIVRTGHLFRFASSEASACDRAEDALSAWLGRPVCAVSSGTAGLRAALAAAGVTPGDVVLVSAFTFIASASAVLAAGARPEPVDIGEALEIDLDDLRTKLRGARAMIGVYAPGHPSNMAAAAELVRATGAAFIEDACQALGVSTNGARAGTIGDFGVFSFQQGKQLCTGEGGAVSAATAKGAARVRRFSDHGADRGPDNRPSWAANDGDYGDNLRMTELQAAVLLVQAQRLDMMLGRQRRTRAALTEVFQRRACVVPSLDPDGHAGNHLLLIAPSEDEAAQAIEAARQHGVWLQWVWRSAFCDSPLIRRRFPDRAFSVPRAQELAGRILTLPVPPLESDEADALLDACTHMFEKTPGLWS